MADKPKKADTKYQVTVVVEVAYLSRDAHDQTFWDLFSEIFQTATQEYRKYRFEVVDMAVRERGKQ